MITITQLEIWAGIAQSALNFIAVYIITGNAQKQTVLDQKVDLRTTKEDIMTELKESRSVLLKELDMAHSATVDIIVKAIEANNCAEKRQE